MLILMILFEFSAEFTFWHFFGLLNAFNEFYMHVECRSCTGHILFFPSGGLFFSLCNHFGSHSTHTHTTHSNIIYPFYSSNGTSSQKCENVFIFPYLYCIFNDNVKSYYIWANLEYVFILFALCNMEANNITERTEKKKRGNSWYWLIFKARHQTIRLKTEYIFLC